MKQLFFIAIIFIALGGCFSGNREVKESVTGADESVNTDSTVAQPDAMQGSARQATGNPLMDSLRFGMSEKDVVALLGEPTNKETVGKDPKIYAEDWWYGENQKVRMINHTVNHVVKDVVRQRELLKELVDAKKNNDEAAAKRIMDELTEGHK